jgi:hypothetical protein
MLRASHRAGLAIARRKGESYGHKIPAISGERDGSHQRTAPVGPSRGAPSATGRAPVAPRAGGSRQVDEIRGSPLEPRSLETGKLAPGSDRAARGASRRARSGARAGPLRANVGVAVRLLPRRCVRHGLRPRDEPNDRDPCSALRGRPPVELRWVRLSRAQSRLRPQRLRRDASWSVGMGRQAPRCKHRRRGARSEHRTQASDRDGAGRGRPVPNCDAPLREHEGPRCLVRPGRRECARGRAGTAQAPPGQGCCQRSSQGPQEGQRARLSQNWAIA